MSNQELAEQFHKPIIRKFEKCEVLSPFIDNIWGVDLADMQLISKFNKGILFLLCVIDIFSKYAWIFPLKDKKGTPVTNAFQKILDKSNHKPNKIWIDKARKFYNRSIKSWIEKNDIEMYSVHNEIKSVAAEKFIRILKYQIYKYVTSVSKNVYINKLNIIVDKDNNIYHSTIKMRSVDVKSNSYINSSKDINDKDPDHARVLKHKNIFAKGYVSNWFEEVFLIKKSLKILCSGHMFLVIIRQKDC